MAAVYEYAGWNFRSRLPAKSVGRIAIVASMSLLALCYLTHPWVIRHEEYAAVAAELWRMQKFFVAVGMLLDAGGESVERGTSIWRCTISSRDIPNGRMLDTSLKNEVEWAQRNHVACSRW